MTIWDIQYLVRDVSAAATRSKVALVAAATRLLFRSSNARTIQSAVRWAPAAVFTAIVPVILTSASRKRLRREVRNVRNILLSLRAVCLACTTGSGSSHLEYAGPKYAKSMKF